MAKHLTKIQASILRHKSKKLEKQKAQLQAEQGKDFVNHGQGVIPEEVWQNLPGKKAKKNG